MTIPIFKIFLLSFLLVGTLSCSSSSKETNENIDSKPTKTGQNKFILTHMNGKLLDKNAEFRIHENYWELDMKNGDVVKYNILFKDEMAPLCGVKAVDTFDDTCMICATIEKNKATIDFMYSKGKLTYTGFFE